jgi:hypothetical protein
MKKETREIKLKDIKTKMDLLFIEETDRKNLKKLYKYWHILNVGMKKFLSRGVNIPEGISEGAFCLDFNKNSARVIKVSKGSGSFDVIDLKTKKRIQIKAVSVNSDLTSFGPKSVWDDLFFLDFYRKGKFDGSFDVYKIPNKLIYNHKVNKNQTFKQQQKEKRRPRFSIKDGIIKKHKIKPIKTCQI